jgi:alpha-galactosidase
MAVLAPRNGYWILETAHTAYALGINARGILTSTYWGTLLPFPEDYPQPTDTAEAWASFTGHGQLAPEEYPAYAGVKYSEPSLKVTLANGVRDTVLQFVAAEVADDTLILTLRDANYPLSVALHYRVHADHDLIERRVAVTNTGAEPATLERVWSADWHLPWGGDYRLSHVSGRWFDEWQLHREPLVAGVKIRESRRLTTSHHANPWFAVDRG